MGAEGWKGQRTGSSLLPHITREWLPDEYMKYPVNVSKTLSLTFCAPHGLQGRQADFQWAIPTCQVHLAHAPCQPGSHKLGPMGHLKGAIGIEELWGGCGDTGHLTPRCYAVGPLRVKIGPTETSGWHQTSFRKLQVGNKHSHMKWTRISTPGTLPGIFKDSRKIANDSQSITNFNQVILMCKQSLGDSTH